MIKSLILCFNLFLALELTAQVSIAAVDLPVTQDFNAMATSGTNSTMPAGWSFSETGVGSNATYTAGTGSSAIADTYSFGATSAADRALGELTGTIVSVLGANFTNNTGVTISSLLIQYTGEQWRLGTTGRVDQLDFEYSTNATSLSTGTWNVVNALDFVAPVTTGTPGALDGNSSANRTFIGNIITGLSITNGSSFWIRWVPLDATNNDDGLSIDDFSISANAITHYTISTAGSNVVITDAAGNGETLTFQESGSNFRVFVPGRTYSLNAGATTAFPINIAIAGQNSFTINAGNGNDVITGGGFATSMPAMTFNGGNGDDAINFTGDINFINNASLDVDLQDDSGTPGVDQVNFSPSTNLILSGNGSAELKVSRNILFDSGSSLVTANGNLTVETNQQVTPTTGTFAGISVISGLLQVTGTGILTALGKGGTSGVNQYGVLVSTSGDIIGGTAGTMIIQGTGGVSTSNSNSGIIVTGSGSSITTSGAGLNITGLGGGSGSAQSNIGVLVSSAGSITTGGTGLLNVQGTGGVASGSSNDGVRVTGTNSIISSGGGNVIITGFGGGTASSSTSIGVTVLAAGTISAGGSGTVDVMGTGGATTGANSFGVQVQAANSMITSSGGNVHVEGHGGGTGNSTSSIGVHISTTAKITAGNLGDVDVEGYGGAGTGANNHGVIILNASSMITSTGGDVMVTGIAGGGGSAANTIGIYIDDGTITAGGAGNVNITGTGSPATGANNHGVRVEGSPAIVSSSGGDITITGLEGGSSSSFGIFHTQSADITTVANGGGILFISNSISIDATVTTDATEFISLRPFANNTPINLGSSGDIVGGPLQLSDQELDSLSTGTIYIGNTNSGVVTTTADITRSVSTIISIFSTDGIVIDDGLINTAGGNLLLDPGNSPDAVEPLKTGTEIICGTLSFGGPLNINIDGITPDVSHTQLNLNGTISLTTASLSFTGTYSPLPGDVFTIILNDDADAIIGTFPGLAQGATITNFLNSGLPATISYIGGTGNDVVITVGSPHYTVTTTGNNLVITNVVGSGHNIFISENGANYRFTVGGATFSLNGGAVTNLPVDVGIAGLNSITINASAGNDVINHGGFTNTLPSLTINGGIGNETINMTGDITFATNANLNLDLQNDDVAPGTDAITVSTGVNIILSGTGAATIRVSKNFVLNADASIETINGNLIIEANQQITPSTGNFVGLDLNGGLLKTTGTGITTIKGKGGTTNGTQIGIQLRNGGDIMAGTTGTLTIEGTGGLSNLSTNIGVYLTGDLASITTSGASIQINANAGGTSGSNNHGLSMDLGADISAAGSGNITIVGFGGNAGGQGSGVRLINPVTSISTVAGNIHITGTGIGTAGNSNYGITLSLGSAITTGGTGTITLMGTGGNGSGSSNTGVSISSAGTTVSTTNGNITVSGQSGTGGLTDNNGVSIQSGGTVSAGGDGDVVVTGTSATSVGGFNLGVIVAGTDALITTADGDINVTGTGGGNNASINNHGVFVLSSGRILAGGNGNVYVEGHGGAASGNAQFGVSLGSANTLIASTNGDVEVVGFGGGITTSGGDFGVAMTGGAAIKSLGAGNVIVEGNGGFGSGLNHSGVIIQNATTVISSQGGNISITGQGNGSGASGNCVGISISTGPAITALNAGNIQLTGNGGVVTGNNSYGIHLLDSDITTTDGHVTIHATGGGTSTSSGNTGIVITSGTTITSAGNGNINITAQGGPGTGNGNTGFSLSGLNTSVFTNNGNITISATGGGSGVSTSNSGMIVDTKAFVHAGGDGDIIIEAIAGSCFAGQNNGLGMANEDTRITSVNGDINIFGDANASGSNSNCNGVHINSGAYIQSTGAGSIFITGESGLASGSLNNGVLLLIDTASILTNGGDIHLTGTGGTGTSSYGINLDATAIVSTATNGGDVTLEANAINIAGNVSTQNTSSTFIYPLTSTDIMLEDPQEDFPFGPIQLTENELDKIVTGTLVIGNAITDTITIRNSITRSALTNIQLLAGGDILLDTGIVNTNGGDLLLSTGNLPFAVKPYNTGNDLTVDALTLNGNLHVHITGLVPDTEYDQLDVIGNVTIAGASLIITGSMSTSSGQAFVLIDNDGADAVTGTFTGLPEGASIPSFLGGNLPAIISYVGGTGNDVVITVASPHYLITNINGDLDITDLAGNGETLTMSQSGSNINFSVPGRNYSLNGSVLANFPVNIPLAGIDSISIHAATGNDIVNVSAFTSPLPHLTVNGGIGNDAVNMNGDITFLSNANLNIDLQNDNPTPGLDNFFIAANTDLLLSGTGSALVKVSQGITMNASSILQTQNGNLTLEANYQTVPSATSFSGVYILNAQVSVTGTGAMIVKGKAGQSNNQQHGVRVEGGGDIIGGTTGTVIIEGIGALATNQSCYGVLVLNAGSTITSLGAHVQITGYGGGVSISGGSSGVEVSTGGTISAGGTGNVIVNGTGGIGSGTNNNGVRVFSFGTITSSGGNVTVTGLGISATNAFACGGVSVLGAGVITAGGNGNVTVTGTGGPCTGDSNNGVSVSGANSFITSSGGDVHVVGIGGGTGSSFMDRGVHVLTGGVITAGGNGDVLVEGTGGPANSDSNIGVQVTATGSSISSAGGDVHVIGLGGGANAAVNNYGVSVDNGGSSITAGGMGNVLVEGTGGNTTGNNNWGVRVRGSNSQVTSSGGNVHVIGEGNGFGASTIGIGVGVELGGKISAGGNGSVTVEGTGALNTASSAYGVYITAVNTTVTSSGGNVLINGTGRGAPSSFGNLGVFVVNGAIVTAGNMGSVTINGQGGAASGNSNFGVGVQQSGSLITSAGGPVIINGMGGGIGSSQINRGVQVTFAGKISAGGTGDVIITGTGGPSAFANNVGVAVENASSSITSGGGDVIITGIEGANSVGFQSSSSASVSTAVSGGHITINSNSMVIGASVSTNTSHTVLLKPYLNGKKIDINAGPDIIGGPLRLTDNELDFITTGTLIIGSTAADTITVGTFVTRTAMTDMELITGGDIIINPGSVNTAMGDLLLHSGTTPKATKPTRTGNDATVDTLTLENNLAILINGTMVDAQYTQLNVAGNVNLNNANLLLSGTYVPVGGELFIIVNNDAVDPVTGIFSGINEGDTLYNFLGSSFKATLTYAGGDGNDVVIGVVNPCIVPDIPTVAAVPDTICEGTLVNLSITAGNLGGGTDWHWYENGCGSSPVGIGNSIMVSPSSTTTYFVKGEGGCVTTSQCGSKTVVVNPYPDATIQRTANSDCYFTENLFQPLASVIPGATYTWNFGDNATPASATGYGPHAVSYTVAGTKNVKLVIHPNAAGEQCADSTSLSFDIIVCTTQILGRVQSVTNTPINGVNVRLFADENTDGIADNNVALRNVNTPSSGVFSMANLTPGSYVIVETQPSNWISFDDGDTSDDGDIVPNSDSLDNIIPVTLVPSEVDSMNVFIESPVAGSITGNVFYDQDGDQAPDTGEGIPNVIIELFADQNANGIADTGVPITSVLTNQNGAYIFSPVPVGNYVIVETQPIEYISFKDFDATNDGDVVPNTNMLNDTIPLTVVNAENDAHNFFIDVPECGLLVTNLDDEGVGSLRHALGCAEDGDTVRFHSSLAAMTIFISSNILLVDKQVVIMSTLTPRITISSEINGLFEILPEGDIEFIDLNIIGGLSTGLTGSAFENQGILRLNNTDVIRNPSFPSGEYLIRNHPDSQFEILGNCLLKME